MLSRTNAIKVGQKFAGKVKLVSLERILAFSGGPLTIPNWPRKNHHTDLTFAKNIGLETLCVSATQYMGHLVSLLMSVFGDEWLSRGKFNVKFTRVVPPGEQLQAKAVVRSITSQGAAADFELDVWVENQNGEKVLSGTAAGRFSL
jgi:acyl dehydratase